jgi:two-component system, NarL family, nitrate/nitrite response regulator NarL
VRPEVLLLDLVSRESLAIPRKAMLILPTLRVVAFAVADLVTDVLACAEAGISGYVPNDGSVEDVVAAVLRAMNDELVCSPRVASLLFRQVAILSSGRGVAPIGTALTPREREIAKLIARGLPNKIIARELRLGPATIKNHVHNILQKLNLQRRGEVAHLQFDV